MELNIKLNLEEVNYILHVLSERSYKEAVGVINNISSQSQKQVDEHKPE